MRGDSAYISLEHHGVEDLIHPAAGLHVRWQEALNAEFRDPQIDTTNVGSKQSGPVTVALPTLSSRGL